MGSVRDARCDAHPLCGLTGMDVPGSSCCPSANGSFQACCPLVCEFDGLRCLPVGRTDVGADEQCAERLKVPGVAPVWALPAGAAMLLCQLDA